MRTRLAVLTVSLAVGLLAGCAGGASSTATTATPGGPGRFQGQVDIGDGRKLYLSCSGRGTPTVILQSGYHDSSRLWSFDEPTPPAVGPSVEERLAERVRVCSYDRPGNRGPQRPARAHGTQYARRAAANRGGGGP